MKINTLSVVAIDKNALYFDIQEVNAAIKKTMHSTLPSDDRLEVFCEKFEDKRVDKRYSTELRLDLGCVDVCADGNALCTVMSSKGL